MGIISNLRYGSANEVLRLAKEHNITDVKVGFDGRGFYFLEGTLPKDTCPGITVHTYIPPTVVSLDPPAPAIATGLRASGVARSGVPGERAPRAGGAVAKVHEFLNGPGAGLTRKEVIAALAEQGINPSTASVQYGAWQKTRAL